MKSINEKYAADHHDGADDSYWLTKEGEKVMMDSCQNCRQPIPPHTESEYCSKCADMDYGFMSAGEGE